MQQLNPKDFIVTRKRKRYKFALFQNSPLCFEANEWEKASGPNILEVGAGTGLFSVGLATQYSHRQFVAMDVKADRLQTGARRAEEQALSNVRFLRAQVDFIENYFIPNSLDAIWITFPDPFARERSAKHRLTHPNFLEKYRHLLKKDGALYFKTDSRNLFMWSLEKMVEGGWSIRELNFDLHESNLPDHYKIKTTYEDRFMNEGLQINFVKAVSPE